MKSSTKNIIVIASVAVLLILWEAAALCIGSENIMPGPWATLVATIKLFGRKDFVFVVLSTVFRGIVSFVIAVVLGVALGIVAGLHEGFGAFMKPWVVVMRSTPVVAFVLLALIWFSRSTAIFIGVLTMFPIIFTNIVTGIRNVDAKLIEMALFYKVRRRSVIRNVYVPSIAPFMVSGISSAVGIGWRAIIVGEVLSQPRYGIGGSLQLAQMQMNVDVLIAWTIIAVLLGALFEKIIRLIENVTVKRHI